MVKETKIIIDDEAPGPPTLIMKKEKEFKCIICEGKFSVGAVASTCTSEPVCKKHIEEITKWLMEKQKSLEMQGDKLK